MAEGRQVTSEIHQFATSTPGLLALSDWLTERRVTHVAMEATGVYWKPVWHVLDEVFELVLANAAHIRNVPGRKSDVTDAAWIADLLAHGLIRSSFVPPPAVQALRDLTRTRKQLVRELAQHTQRIQKTLEDANIKLGTVISNVVGVSGRAILEATIAGETDPEVLAARGDGRLQCARDALVEALQGRVTAHHRFVLRQHLQLVDSLQTSIAAFEGQIGAAMEPFRHAAERLRTIPGVSTIAAHVLVAEVGIDMTRFPTARHLVSWAGLCPRLDESAGKARSRRVRKGCAGQKLHLLVLPELICSPPSLIR
jgi:transposase